MIRLNLALEHFQACFNCCNGFGEAGGSNMHRDRQALDKASSQDVY
jgi:hypothetical protein